MCIRDRYHSATGATKKLRINSDEAASTTGLFENTEPTSSVFSVGDSNSTNGNGNNMIAYCFAPVAGYSAFGSYEGNGSSDGPFVHTGFAVSFLMLKNADASGVGWIMFDSARDIDNPTEIYLFANTSSGEDSSSVIQLDFLSNGFKINGNWNGFNGSGNTIIYIAFAEHPQKTARAR